MNRVRRIGPPPPALWVLLVLMVVLAVFAPGFLSGGNLGNVARTGSILALAAFGQAIVIITRGLDLSSATAVALMSVVTVLVLDLGVVPAMLIGCATVLVSGAVNGWLVAQFEIPPFLVTLGTYTAMGGLASMLVGGIPIEAPPTGAFSWPSNARLGPIPMPVIFAGVALFALSWIFNRTVLGRNWFLIGSNPEAAIRAGVPVRFSLFLAYLVASGFVAVAGLLLTSRVHSGQPHLYPTLSFEAIAACAIGGLALSGGVGSAGRVLIGVAIVSFIGNGLRLMNISSDVQLMVIGILTVVAVAAQRESLGLGLRRLTRRSPRLTRAER